MVFGTRSSSQTSTETSQDSPSHWKPLTASDSYPVSSAIVCRAAIVRSRADMRPSERSLRVDSAMTPSSPLAADGNQPLEQDVLGLRRRRVVDLARLARRFDLHQLRADRALVVELGLRLFVDALGDPDRAADGSERKREQAGDQAHASLLAFAWSPVKLYGASGPT